MLEILNTPTTIVSNPNPADIVSISSLLLPADHAPAQSLEQVIASVADFGIHDIANAVGTIVLNTSTKEDGTIDFAIASRFSSNRAIAHTLRMRHYKRVKDQQYLVLLDEATAGLREALHLAISIKGSGRPITMPEITTSPIEEAAETAQVEEEVQVEPEDYYRGITSNKLDRRSKTRQELISELKCSGWLHGRTQKDRHRSQRTPKAKRLTRAMNAFHRTPANRRYESLGLA